MHHFVVKFYSRMPLQTTHRTAFDLHYWRLNDYCELLPIFVSCLGNTSFWRQRVIHCGPKPQLNHFSC